MDGQRTARPTSVSTDVPGEFTPAEVQPRVVLAGAVESIVEYFDFGVYGYVATIIAAKFFVSGDENAALLLTHTGTSWVVMDASTRDRVASKEPEFAELVELNGVREADTAEALADAIGCDPVTLRATLEAAAAAARGEAEDEFGRTDFGYGPLGAPLCAVRSRPALFHTQGGVRVDADGRVLRTDDTPIEGLYAGGGVAAGVSGQHGGAGYSSGNGLLAALGLGRLAGSHAGRRARESRAQAVG